MKAFLLISVIFLSGLVHLNHPNSAAGTMPEFKPGQPNYPQRPNAPASTIPEQKQTCACPYIYAPECGIDGQTYPNSCVRECSRIPLWYKGECKSYPPSPPFPPPQPPPQPTPKPTCGMCPSVYEPECGVNGKTYSNSCFRICAYVALWYKGECNFNPPSPPNPRPPGNCICPAVVDPECGVDGKTYGNSCERQCAGVPLLYKGSCSTYPPPPGPPPNSGCVCTMQYDPECGIDGKTYGNSCQRNCAGVPLQHKGECYATHQQPIQIQQAQPLPSQQQPGQVASPIQYPQAQGIPNQQQSGQVASPIQYPQGQTSPNQQPQGQAAAPTQY